MRVRYVRPYRASTDAGPVVVVSTTWSMALAVLVDTGHQVDGWPGPDCALRGVEPSRWTNTTTSREHMRHVSLRHS